MFDNNFGKYIQLYSPNGSNIKTTNNLTKHNKLSVQSRSKCSTSNACINVIHICRGPIFKKSFSNRFRKKILYANHKDVHLTCNMFLHYLVKVENPKMLLILTAYSTNC